MLSTLAVLLLLAPQPPPSPRAEAPDVEEKREQREKEEPPVVTRHEARVGGRTLRYSVTTGMMPLRSEAGETEADVFYMAYVADRPAATSGSMRANARGWSRRSARRGT